MTDATQPSTPPGWYTDPGGSGQLRWWSGAAWTEHLAPAAPVVVAPAVPAAAATPVFTGAPVFSPAPAVATAPPEPQGRPLVPAAASTPPFSSAPSSLGGRQTATFSRGGYFPSSTGVRGATAAPWSEPTRWSTPEAFALALSPIWGSLLGVLLGFVFGLALVNSPSLNNPFTQLALSGGLSLVAILISIGLALQDRKKLVAWGYDSPASAWWILLGPLVYLILRTVAVRRVVRRGGAPLWTYLGIIGGTLVLSVAVAILVPTLLASSGFGGAFGGSSTLSGTTLARGIEQGANANGKSYSVTCPPTVSSAIGTEFTCTAVDNAGTGTYSLVIDVVADASGKPTVKLKSTTKVP